MAREQQSAHQSVQDTALLEGLLGAPAPARDRGSHPARLRSAHQQRAIALQGYLRRTWVDQALRFTERLLLVAALGAFAFWLGDGPIRDWLYLRSAQRAVAAPGVSRAPVVATVPTPALPQSFDSAVEPRPDAQPSTLAPAALPFVTDSDTRGSRQAGDAFLVPGYVPADNAISSPQPTWLAIPAIGLDTPVVETFLVDGVWEVAEYAAGYMSGTALPGAGNTALAGHVGLRGAVFRDLHRLQPGDSAFLDANGWRYEYRVRETRTVWPTQVEILDPTPSPVLTLITCVNWDTQRLIVSADLVGATPLAAP